MPNKVSKVINRNKYDMNNQKVEKNKVVLEYWKETINVGDILAPVICKWMLEKKNIDENVNVSGYKHLLSVGSVVGIGEYPFDATIWGSGIHHLKSIVKIAKASYVRKLDVRALRGPVTAIILERCGYKNPGVYGDPAILMPLIYDSKVEKISSKISVIPHYKSIDVVDPEKYNIINPKTDDYKKFIDEICSSELVISSSLHGIILAESYGVPAVFWQNGMDKELLKFYDWYYSTGRKNIKMAYTLEEACSIQPMELPVLDELREKLMDSFPYDLYLKK